MDGTPVKSADGEAEDASVRAVHLDDGFLREEFVSILSQNARPWILNGIEATIG